MKPTKKLNEIGNSHNGMEVIGRVAGRALNRYINGHSNNVEQNQKYARTVQDAMEYLPGGKKDHSKDWGDQKANALHRVSRTDAFTKGMSKEMGVSPKKVDEGCIHLTESQLRAIIRESVMQVMKGIL